MPISAGSDGPGEHGPRPTILYGYGGFGVRMAPGYAPPILAWVEQGGIYAIACPSTSGCVGVGSYLKGSTVYEGFTLQT